MIIVLRWVRVLISFVFFLFCIFCLFYYRTSLYILSQASGQLSVLTGTTSIAEFKTKNELSGIEKENLDLVEAIKRYSVDSLDYKPTKNFTTIYNQHHAPVLWVVTASAPYSFDTYTWHFPIVGKVSYKGFFKESLAEKEYNHLHASGYDVDLRSVSAWSTLGWFNDPLLSSMLNRRKGSLCNLLFHELFHATYYAEGSVDLNENLASFIAHEATVLFLKNDSASLQVYLNSRSDNRIFTNYMLRKKDSLTNFYNTIKDKPNRNELKVKALLSITDSIEKLPIRDRQRFVDRKSEIMRFKNAYFVDFQQYDSMQDSLEVVFNKIYKRNLKKLVQDLKLNRINY